MCKTCCDCRSVTPKIRTTAPDYIEIARDLLTSLAAEGVIKIERNRRAEFGKLYELYVQTTPHPIGPNALARALSALGFPTVRGTNGVRQRIGIVFL